MSNRPTFRWWPLAMLGAILVVVVFTWFFEELKPALRLDMRSLPPGAGHWLGTDTLGRDVWLAILAGSQRSILVSIGAALIGGSIGVGFGSVAAFFGNDRLRFTIRTYLTGLLLLLIAVYFAAVLWPTISSTGQVLAGALIVLLLVVSVVAIWWLLKRFSVLAGRMTFPLDTITQRFIEVISVIPRLYLIVAFAMIIPINMFTLIMLFAVTSWDVMARMVRAEMLKVREMTYIESARVIGLSESKVFFRHALPNAIGPVATQVCFTISGLLIAEATLSFIGVGVSPETVSWGSIIHGYLENLQAWWLAVFPGICIYLTVISLHALGNDLDRMYHRK
ncbi:MAG: ABC transporter permease [Imperialibacter sp.]